MEPLKPESVRDLLANAQAAPGDVEEYERLLAERFTRDPDLPQDALESARIDTRHARLDELYRKLYPSGPSQPPGQASTKP
jgi:hypothetical protein